MNGVAITGYPEFRYKDNGNVKTVKFTLHPAWKKELIEKAIANYDKAISLVKDGDTDFAKALKLHDWIVNNITYGDMTNGGNGINALANKKAVCAGYAYTYQFLLSQAGVESIYVAADTNVENTCLESCLKI